MPSVPKRVHVVKIPKSNEGVAQPAIQQKVMPNFDRMPRMYLELLENKDKIRPHLVNKEYDPEDASSVYSFDLNPSTVMERPVHTPRVERVVEEEEEEEESDEDEESEVNGPASSVGSPSPVQNVEEASERSVTLTEDDSKSTASAPSSSASSSKTKPSVVDKNDNEDVVSLTSSRQSSHRSGRPPLTSREEEVKNRTKEKLQKMLFSEERQVPTLSELKKRGEVKESGVIADLNRAMGDKMEEEDELKRELLFKFELLKKSYKHVNVPEFNMHSDYRNMNQTYENTLRQVSLDSNVESYKSLLVGGFMLLEFILGYWLKFDMSGFSQQQILNMNQYERLLIELGEKSYIPGGSQWPVEIRLLGLIVMNAIIFIVSKMILKKTGSNLVGLMNSVNTVMGAPSQKPKRRMRGPSVDLDAIPEVRSDDDV